MTTDDVATIIGWLFSAYCLGWASGYGLYVFKRLLEFF